MTTISRVTALFVLALSQLLNSPSATAAEGFDATFEITGIPNNGVTSTWRYLQVVQVHLKELEQNQFLSEIGCVTNVATLDCAALASATATTPLIGDVRSVTYRVFKTDWKVFRTMATEAEDRFSEEETGVVKLKRSKVPVSIPEPACNPPPGCYARAICTMYSGCSKSQYSCVKCN